MSDAMLAVLYQKAFEIKYEFDHKKDISDYRKQALVLMSQLIGELIDIRTDQIRRGH
jgi:hypothetical protein